MSDEGLSARPAGITGRSAPCRCSAGIAGMPMPESRLRIAAVRLLSESMRNCADTTIVSPSAMPSSTSHTPSPYRPRVTAATWNVPGDRSRTTRSRVPPRITAASGTTSASRATGTSNVTLAYMPARSVRSGFSSSMETVIVRVRSSKCGYR